MKVKKQFISPSPQHKKQLLPKPRSRFRFFFGILLGGLAVGLLWAAGANIKSRLGRSVHAMSARQAPDLAQRSVARPRIMTKAPIRAIAMVKPSSKPIPTKVAALIPRPISADRTPSTASIPRPLAKPSIQLTKANLRNPVSRPEPVLSADEVGTKSDELLLQKVRPSGVEAAGFQTLRNARYQKSTLSTCKAACLLKATDAKGNAISAIINGPEYSGLLNEHQGTINITGKKVIVRNVELFMVQSITFNLSPR